VRLSGLHEGPAQAQTVDGALEGSWSATRWHYTSRRDPARTVDLVIDLRGTVTLSLSAGTYILAWDVPGRGRRSVSGRWARRGDSLEYSWPGADGMERAAIRLGREELSLSTEASAWDFDGNGDVEPAGFVGVFVKL